MMQSNHQDVFFYLLTQKVYVFFAVSFLRWQVLLKYVKNSTLKPLSETSWESRIDALKPLRYHIGDI